MLDEQTNRRLRGIARRTREHIIRMAGRGGCFLGSAFSCVDILVYLYFRVIGEQSLKNDRDYFLLSKGHAVPALYGVMAEMGRLPASRLRAHLSVDDNIYWHPNRAMPGVEFHSGSLGHGLALAIGIAIDLRLRGSKKKVFVLLGDGELDEGSVWEALLVASAQKLNNLVAIVDRNGFQANFQTEHLLPLEPLIEKFRAFGCEALIANGHSFQSLSNVFSKVLLENSRPSVVIANTVRGKGIPRIEADWEQWFVKIPASEVELWIRELHKASV